MSENAGIPKHLIKHRNCRPCRERGHGEVPRRGYQCPYGRQKSASNANSQASIPLGTLSHGVEKPGVQLPPPRSPIQSDRIRTTQMPVSTQFSMNGAMNGLTMTQIHPFGSSRSPPTPLHSSPHIHQPDCALPPQPILIDPSLSFVNIQGISAIRDPQNAVGSSAAPYPTPSPSSGVPSRISEPGDVEACPNRQVQQPESAKGGIEGERTVLGQDREHQRSIGSGLSSPTSPVGSPSNTLCQSQIPTGEGPPPPTAVCRSGAQGSDPVRPGTPHSLCQPSPTPPASTGLPNDAVVSPQTLEAPSRFKHGLDLLDSVSHESPEEPPKKRLKISKQKRHTAFIPNDKDCTDAYSKRIQTILSKAGELSDTTGAYVFVLAARPETLGQGNTKYFISENLHIDDDTVEELETKLTEISDIFVRVREVVHVAKIEIAWTSRYPTQHLTPQRKSCCRSSWVTPSKKVFLLQRVAELQSRLRVQRAQVADLENQLTDITLQCLNTSVVDPAIAVIYETEHNGQQTVMDDQSPSNRRRRIMVQVAAPASDDSVTEPESEVDGSVTEPETSKVTKQVPQAGSEDSVTEPESEIDGSGTEKGGVGQSSWVTLPQELQEVWDMATTFPKELEEGQ
ncbi:hypothetical protein M422DRAFT_275030 [Sphaerobolus stellatus SS14]|uniref:Uncharacterized protein n=1 Tax=Sphaerobolus stellatus (strain SS14) TaxID=990650 RepID=A0A0C9T5Q3_SPHS4|nr:hypothetical protein M422DRAFT_275030 [Sphaerobolus stellatus SS14]